MAGRKQNPTSDNVKLEEETLAAADEDVFALRKYVKRGKTMKGWAKKGLM